MRGHWVVGVLVFTDMSVRMWGRRDARAETWGAWAERTSVEGRQVGGGAGGKDEVRIYTCAGKDWRHEGRRRTFMTLVLLSERASPHRYPRPPRPSMFPARLSAAAAAGPLLPTLPAS